MPAGPGPRKPGPVADPAALEEVGLVLGKQRRQDPSGGPKESPMPGGSMTCWANVAEWCLKEQPDQPPVVRGGSYNDRAAQVSCGARMPEVPEWDASDPQRPKGKWWLSDAPFVGFRLVCEGDRRMINGPIRFPGRGHQGEHLVAGWGTPSMGPFCVTARAPTALAKRPGPSPGPDLPAGAHREAGTERHRRRRWGSTSSTAKPGTGHVGVPPAKMRQPCGPLLEHYDPAVGLPVGGSPSSSLEAPVNIMGPRRHWGGTHRRAPAPAGRVPGSPRR
jgi:hypothetical protein